MSARGAEGIGSADAPGSDLAVRVTVAADLAEVAGAILMEPLGSFELAAPSAEWATLVFYPRATQLGTAEPADVVGLVLEWLSEELVASGRVTVETGEVSRDWAEGWRDHFRPIVIGEVRIRPPWEAPADAGSGLVDVVINPGLGFGTGLHPTTRGTLELLQGPGPQEGDGERFRGPLVDVGTGSGILAIAAAKLGWGPVFAFDNDPVALGSARENVEANGVGGIVEIHQADVEGASAYWFSGATVLANMTLDPVLALVKRLARQQDDWNDLAPTQPTERLVVSGILAGDQERQLRDMVRLGGLAVGRTRYEGEWVSLELWPSKPASSAEPVWG